MTEPERRELQRLVDEARKGLESADGHSGLYDLFDGLVEFLDDVDTREWLASRASRSASAR